jgi:hypothetical protein
MLSREVMGALALAILWVNTLLIAAAAAKAGGALARLGRGFGAIAKGQVVRGDGEAGAIAALEIEQVGRLGAGADAVIAFHDRSHACRVFGGRVRLDGGEELDLAPGDDAEVWVDAARVAAVARSATDASFEVASGEARKARGHTRSFRATVVAGDTVFLAAPGSSGAPTPEDGASPRAARLVSTFDPRPWIAKRTALAYAFVVAEIAVAAACTAAALQAPHFGPVSMAGAAAAFVFFLLVQPAGTLVRDALRPPSRSLRHDTWARPAPGRPEPSLALGARAGEPPRGASG